MIPIWITGGPGGLSLFLRPSSVIAHSLSMRVAAKAPGVAALAPRDHGSGSAIDATGVLDAQRYEARLRWVAYRLRQRYARNRGLRALGTANDALLAVAALSMLLRAAAFLAAVAQVAMGAAAH